jgi:hypothetical protein
MTRAHSLWGGSVIQRRIACPLSARLEDGKAGRSSSYAEAGTARHDCAEDVLRNGGDAKDRIGQRFNGHNVDAEFAAEVQVYVDKVKAYPGLQFIEEEVNYDRYVPGGYGHLDAAVLDVVDERLVVLDAKFGRGHRVTALDSGLPAYAVGMLEATADLCDVAEVELVIVQPPLDHVDTAILSTDELRAWAEGPLSAAYEEAQREDPPSLAGEHCTFCKGKPECTTYAEANRAAADVANVPIVFDDLEVAEVTGMGALAAMDRDQLGKLYLQLDLVRRRCDEIAEYCRDEVSAGREIPGLKLVAGRKGTRKWTDEAAVERMLTKTFRLRKDEAYVTKVLSPSQAEKVLSKVRMNKLSGLISQAPGKPTLVAADDPRPSVAIAFDNLEQNDE